MPDKNTLMERVNIQRSLAHYCLLIGRYGELCDISVRAKNDKGENEYIYKKKRDEFVRHIYNAIRRFCGIYFGDNPDVLPHPIRIALEIKNGHVNAVKQALDAIGKPEYLPRVVSLMHNHGMIEADEVVA